MEIRARSEIRVAQESVRGELTRVLRPDGRLVAPAAIPVPAGIRELARDEREWVGAAEGDAATAPVPLRRR